MRYMHFVLISAMAATAVSAASDSSQRAGDGYSSSARTISIDQAVQASLSSNFGLKSDSIEIAVQSGNLQQARLPENPEFSIEAENIGIRNNRFDRGTRFTWEVEQSFQPIARLAGVRAARSGIKVADRRYQISKADLEAEVKSLFLICLASQQLLVLSDTLREVARKAHEISVLQARAGKTQISDTLTTAAEYSLAIVRRDREQRELVNAYRNMSALWGGTSESILCVGSDLDSVIAVPDSTVLLSRVDSTPYIRVYDAELAAARAGLDYEKSVRMPSITIGAGMESITGSDELVPKASVSFSIPILNWNQGAIKAAQHAKSKTEMIRQDVKTQIRKDLINTWQTAIGLYREIKLLKSTIVPQYRKSFEASLLSYQSGKTDVQILVSAQKSFFEFSREYIDTALKYRLTMVDLERISSQKIVQ